MSLRKKIARQMLRKVPVEEAAFLDLLAAREAFVRAGIAGEGLTPGFLPRPAAKEPTCSPILVVSQGDKAFTYRLDQYKLDGTEPELSQKWREWIIYMINQGAVEEVATWAWEKNGQLSSEAGRRLIRELIERQGMTVLGESS